MTSHDERASWPTDHPEYPRPQQQRAQWINLNGPWKFAFDEKGEAQVPTELGGWTHEITVPFAPESDFSGIRDRGYHANAWYEREFDMARTTGSEVLLHFGAVDYEAHVWVNGIFVGRHQGGHTPFSFMITDALVEGSTQTVTVWAHDDPHELAQPRGKQDWQLEAHSIWYPRTTGIWQTVWVEEVPRTYVEGITWTPDLGRWEIGFDAVIAGRGSQELEIRVRLAVGDRLLSDDRYRVIESEVRRKITFSDPGIDDFRNELLWTPETPTLIDAQIELWAGDELIDELRSYTAIRGVAIQRGRILLNNRPYYLRLVLDQGYWEGSMMTPPSEEAIQADIQLVKAAGFNGVRKHQKIEDPRYLYWADRMGLLVWEEMPSAYRFTPDAVERTTREWMEVIKRDRNHPCIITWVPFNESWGVPNLPENEAHRNCVQALYYLTRTLDPTRPVIGNDGWESSATDIVGIHDYDHDPQRILERYGFHKGEGVLPDLLVNGWPGGRVLTLEGHPHDGQPIILSEFGGIAFREFKPGEPIAWGYSVGTTPQDLQNKYAGLLDAVHRIEVFAGFCYTQFTDTFQEANGLFYEDRTPKFDLAAMRAATLGGVKPPTDITVPTI